MELKDKLQTALVVVLAAASLSAKIDAAPSYVATPLGTLGGNGGYANAINQSGEITGFSYLTNWTPPAPDPSVAVHAFVYRGGVMHDLGTLGGMDSEGTAINASGQIVGFSSLPTGQHPFIYVRGLLRDLGTLGGSDAQALAINYRAQATGGSAIAGDDRATQQPPFDQSVNHRRDRRLRQRQPAGELRGLPVTLRDHGQQPILRQGQLRAGMFEGAGDAHERAKRVRCLGDSAGSFRHWCHPV